MTLKFVFYCGTQNWYIGKSMDFWLCTTEHWAKEKFSISGVYYGKKLVIKIVERTHQGTGVMLYSILWSKSWNKVKKKISGNVLDV